MSRLWADAPQHRHRLIEKCVSANLYSQCEQVHRDTLKNELWRPHPALAIWRGGGRQKGREGAIEASVNSKEAWINGVLPLKRSWRGVEGRIGFTRGELETRAMRTQPGCFGKFTQTLKSWLSQEMLIWVWSCVLVFIALHRCCLVCMDQEENEALQYLHCMIEKLLEKKSYMLIQCLSSFFSLSLFFLHPVFLMISSWSISTFLYCRIATSLGTWGQKPILFTSQGS